MSQTWEIADLAAQFKQWSDNRRGVSRLYEALVPKIVDDIELLSLIAGAGRLPFLHNRFMASVHYLLLEGAEPTLRRYYATVSKYPDEPDGKVYELFRAFCFERAKDILFLMRSKEVQINEVRRCAPMVLALNVVARLSMTPLALIDVGTCAGLNLYFDKYFYDFGVAGTLGDRNAAVHICCLAEGSILPRVLTHFPRVDWRRGIDTHPISAADPASRNWLLANISPDDSERWGRTIAALEEAQRASCQIIRGNALDVLEDLIATIPDDVVPCVFHSFVTHHFTELELIDLSDTFQKSGVKRAIYEIGLEFERSPKGICVDRPLTLRLTSYHLGKVRTEELATVDSRGACGWLRWMQVT